MITALPRELGATPFTRANPLARLTPALTLATVNAATLSAPIHLTTLAITALALPLLALSVRQCWRLTWPLLVATATLFIVNTLAYPGSGIHHADVVAGATTATRLLAIALPGLLVFATIDAVDLVDALVQQLRLSPRFGYGALAALRLLPLLTSDWQLQARAARARGVSVHGPVQRVRQLFRRLLGLLVTAVRRATRLSVALDARGFDGARRASARPSSWTAQDWGWCAGGLLAALAAIAIPQLLT